MSPNNTLHSDGKVPPKSLTPRANRSEVLDGESRSEKDESV